MRVFYGFDGLPGFGNAAVTAGSFDGVHAGHRMLLDKVSEMARQYGGEGIAVTFEPHPRIALGDTGIRLLTTLGEKLSLLERAGAENVVVVPFDREFSRLGSHEFLARCIVGKLRARCMVVGYNHRFGRDKEGDFDYLQRVRDEFGLTAVRVDEVDVGGRKVSSTAIRGLIACGETETAAQLLAHRYEVTGVCSGGVFETGDRYKLLPREGRYDVTVGGMPAKATVGGRRITLEGAALPNGETTIRF